MSKIEDVKKIIKRAGGIAKTADFVSEGLSNYDVASLCKKGILSVSDMAITNSLNKKI